MSLVEDMRDLASICLDGRTADELRAAADDLEAISDLGLEWPEVCPYFKRARRLYDRATAIGDEA